MLKLDNEKDPLLLVDPNFNHIQSRRFEWKDVPHVILECAACALCLLCLLWLSLLIIVSLLLSKANTVAVRTACAGFWDFMLISTLSPLIIPTLYCMLSCCAWSWQAFSGGSMLIMGIACLHLTITCSENSTCMDAIRDTTPPLPWLIYMGWLKASLYLAGALSTLVAWYHPIPKHP